MHEIKKDQMKMRKSVRNYQPNPGLVMSNGNPKNIKKRLTKIKDKYYKNGIIS